jgi:2-dehydropantoate 2-reductase
MRPGTNSTEADIRIAIFGVGAMGCLFGARLTPHADITLIGDWPEQIQTLREHPLRLIENDGSESRVSLRATDDIRQVKPADIALILTKTPQTRAAAEQAAKILAPDGLAITLQNGLGNQEVLQEAINAERVTVGVTMLGASTGGQAGFIISGGTGKTVLATRPPIQSRIQALAGLFKQAGLITEMVDDISALLWGKLVVNAAINPLTALLGVPNGALLDSEWTRALMSEVANEVAHVAAAQGIILPYTDATAQVEQVARMTARNHSSMLQDIERGALTEIDAINGAVMRMGHILAVDTPTTRTLYHLIKAREVRYVSPKND